MKINYIEGDMFAKIAELKTQLNESATIIIPHICNDIGAWGAGFVIPLGRNYPEAQQSYLDWVKLKGMEQTRSTTPMFKLGETQFVIVQKKEPKIVVANMIGQRGIGGPPRPIRYNAVSRCLDTVRDYSLKKQIPAINAPMFGAGLAGGDWNFIEQLIQDSWINFGLSVNIFYLPGTLPTNWTLPKE